MIYTAQQHPAPVAVRFEKSNSVHEWLHWLPIKHLIDFKIANITFRTLHFSQPAYLRSSLHVYHSTRSLRLSNTNLLSAPFVRTSFGSRSFSVAAPKFWNSLPLSLRTCTCLDTFRRHLKTHYCQQAFQSTYPLSACASGSALLTIVRVYKLHLHTYYFLTYYTMRQKKGTNFLLCASLIILDRNWLIFSLILRNV